MRLFSTNRKINMKVQRQPIPLLFAILIQKEVVAGQTMKEHLRFAVAYWHTMTQDGSDPFGSPVNQERG